MQFTSATPQTISPPVPPPNYPKSTLGNIWNGLAGGLVSGFPTMAGEALQKFAPAGGALASAGQSMVNFGADVRPATPVDPNSVWGQAAYGSRAVSRLRSLSLPRWSLPASALAAAGVGGLGAALLAGGSAAKERAGRSSRRVVPPRWPDPGIRKVRCQGAVQGIMNAIPGGSALLGRLGERAVRIAAEELWGRNSEPDGARLVRQPEHYQSFPQAIPPR